MGELLIGVALLLGILTGLAALFGAFMNWPFMMAGTASTNPVMLIVAVGILLAWKTAGWWGLDRFVLPYLGTPWQRGALCGSQKIQAPTLFGRAYQHPMEQWVRMLIGVGVALYARPLWKERFSSVFWQEPWYGSPSQASVISQW